MLSEAGVAQSKRLGAWLAEAALAPGAVLHGAMRRQRDTATAMAAGAGWSVAPELDEGWNEFDHLGVVAARPRRPRAGSRRPPTWTAGRSSARSCEATGRWSGGGHDDEYDESWPAFVAAHRGRARPGVRARRGHGGGLLRRARSPSPAPCWSTPTRRPELPRLWNAFNTVSANTGVTRVITGSTGRRMLTFNEHSHLAREQVTYR